MTHANPTSLRAILVRLFFRRPDTETLVLDLGLDAGQIAWDERPVNTWRSVLQQVDRQGKIDDLVRLTGQRYPKDEQLASFSAGYKEIDWRSELYAVDRRFAWAVPDALPEIYVPRPELLAEVRQALLADSNARVHALHGMGGVGKSVLARALCDDPAVQAAFPDGILWATLGQTPDLIPRLRDWIGALGGTVSEIAPTVEGLKGNLAGLLRERVCLLIVDDAWWKAHAEVFRVGGPKCRLLLTTRDAALAEELGATVCAIPVMAEAEAVALLEEWAGDRLRATAGELRTRIVRRLGRLPLAIRLAGAQLKRQDAEQWLASFDARKLKARREEEVHDSLAATFALSLDDLDPTDRRLYVALAIFKEDEPARAAGIARLWSVLDRRSDDDTRELLDDLAARALVEPSQGDGDAILIHDLLRDFMAAELGDEGRQAAHRALLGAYRRTQQDEGWATAPDDGYLYDHLAYHLDQLANQDSAAEKELYGLFADPSWLHARVAQSHYLHDGYIADLERAWRRADEATRRQIDADVEPAGLGDCVRYALIHTSVNSLAGNYDPSLVVRAVETSAWPVERALSVARRIPDAARRATMFTALLKTDQLTSEQRLAIEREGLAPQLTTELPRDKGTLPEMPDRATWLARRAVTLAAYIPQMTSDRLRDNLTKVLAIGDGYSRAYELAALAPQLTGDLLREALTAAQDIGDDDDRADRALVLVALAPQLTSELLREGLRTAHAIVNPEYRAQVLVALAPQLTGEPLREGLTAALAIGDGTWRAHALAAIAPHLTGELLHKGLGTALDIDDEEVRLHAMAALARHLTGELLHKGLAAALSISHPRSSAEALAALAPQLTDDLLRDGLAAVQAIDDEWRRAQALAALAPQLTGDLLRDALVAVRAIGEEWVRAHALAALAPQLTDNLLREALLAAQAIHEPKYRAQVLAALAPQLTGDLLRDGLKAAQVIGLYEYRAQAMAALAPQLTDDLLSEALLVARAIHKPEYRAQVLAALAPQLIGGAQEVALREALAAARAISGERLRAEFLAALAPQLTSELLREGLTAALAIGDGTWRAHALASLAPHLTGELLRDGLEAAQAVDSERGRAEFLAALAPQLTGELLRDGLATARLIGDHECCVRALAALAPQLTNETRRTVLREGLASALAINYDWSRANALAALAPQLKGDLLEEGLAAAMRIGDERYRVDALAALAPQLEGKAQEAALRQGLAAARAIHVPEFRANALAALARQLTGKAQEAALREGLAVAQAIGSHESRAHTLDALLNSVADSSRRLRAIRHALVDHLRLRLADQQRAAVLSFCAEQKLFTPPILFPATLAAVACHIIEICQKWEWHDPPPP